MRLLLSLLGLIVLMPASAGAAGTDARGASFFEKKIQPVLAERCFSCHSMAARKNKKLRGGLFLDSRDGLRKGGEAGPVIVPGNVKKSLLLAALRHEGGLKMPPKEKLPAAVLADFTAWVQMGAPDPRESKTTGAVKKPETNRPGRQRVKRGEKELARFIDEDVNRHLRAVKIIPGEQSSDEAFLRRAYLDVTGRIPTAKQAIAFLDSKAPDKRGKLIDELLASPQYGEQFGRVWRDWIAPADLPAEGNGGNQPIVATRNLGKWFADRFNAGDGWDRIVRQILTVDGNLKDQPQGLFFSLVGDDQGRPEPAGSARAITSLFLGLQLQCAECHNDPFKEWKQADFWGVAAFYRNTKYAFKGRYFDSITESFDVVSKGGRKLANNKDASPNGAITIPQAALKNAGTVIPAKFIGGTPIVAEPKQLLRPVLADWLTTGDNPYFARAFVNRTWAYFFSRGIVHPLDDLRAANPPSHPALLARVTEEFVASGFDVKHLVRCITSTRAYQRTSRPAGEKNAVAAFGRMPIKVLSADALYDSLRLALTDPALDLRGYDSRVAGRFGESSPVGDAYGEFVRLFSTNKDNATEFTHGIPQMLALLNHPRLRSGGKTIDALMKAGNAPEANVEALYLATLSRRPTPAERADAKEFLARTKDPRRACNIVLWTLLNRSEFLLVR